MEFTYRFPVRLEFGRGSIKKIGTVAAEYGKRALILTGEFSAKKTGILERVLFYLKKSGIQTYVFDHVKSNPQTIIAEEAAAYAKERHCDLMIGLGGGSALDCAKAVAFLCKNEGDINDYIFMRETSEKALPVITVPTTCGTGSEINGFAALTNPKNGNKKSLRNDAIIPVCAIVDSECAMTMPKSLLAESGIDTFCHCLEAYISNMAQPFTELLCLEGMRLVYQNLGPLYQGKCNSGVWDALSLASVMGGMAIHSAGVTLVHGMSHPISGLKNSSHAKGLAALLPIVMEATIQGGSKETKKKIAVISKLIGGTDENDCVKKIEEFLASVHMTGTLSELGVLEEDITWLAENCCQVSVPGIACHPVHFNKYQIKELYRKAR